MPMRTITDIATRCCKMNPADQYIRKKIEARVRDGNLRLLSAERLEVDFFSNDYLGFVTSGILERTMADIPADGFDTGSTGSRLLSGNSSAAELLEHTAARFHDAEAALLFNSGYNANTGLIAAVAGRESTILYDSLCHASIHDGIRLSQARNKFKFAHNDLKELEALLVRHQDGCPLYVVVESVYSMDGDVAPLAEIAALAEKHHAALIVDEAHATGVFGARGEGLVHSLGLQNQVFARVHTFGKALGCHGAVVVGSKELVQFLINFSRPFIYTTALPGHAVRAAIGAYTCLTAPGFTNEPLHSMIAAFRQKTSGSAHKWMDSSSPIQAILLPGNENCRRYSALLAQAGIQAKAILSPTVPAGGERIRICLHEFNTAEQIERLFEVLG